MEISQCPKCHYTRQPLDNKSHAGVCPSCGIVYRKWLSNESQGDTTSHSISPKMPMKLQGNHFGYDAEYRHKEAIHSHWITKLGLGIALAAVLALLYLA